MALNREWHRFNRMPVRARGCRDIPDSIKADVEKLMKTRKR